MMVVMFDTVIHKWLRIPYRLHIRYIRKAKRARATVLFIHGLGDTGDMWRPVIEKMPQDVSVVAVDLLGFGESPRPAWEKYDAADQARSLLATYLDLRPRSQVIVVGHSLGALVAVEFAKRYRLLTRALVLCSPPMYRAPDEGKQKMNAEVGLRMLYELAARDPRALLRLYGLGRAARLLLPSVTVDEGNIRMLIASLRASIINQTTFDDVQELSQPVRVISGLLDPFVVRANLVKLTQLRSNITLHTISAGHTIRGRYVGEVVASVEDLLAKVPARTRT